MKVEHGCMAIETDMKRRDWQPMSDGGAGDASAWCDWVGGEAVDIGLG
jgi:hypothetical protein